MIDETRPGAYNVPPSLTQYAPRLNTDSEGVAKNETPVPLAVDWAVMTKRILAGAVVLAGAGAAIFPPHTVAHQVCVAILGLGGLGITSRGNPPK